MASTIISPILTDAEGKKENTRKAKTPKNFAIDMVIKCSSLSTPPKKIPSFVKN